MMTIDALQDDKLYDVTSFEITADYTLRIVFDDGTEQIINFEPVLLGPLFGPLRDIELFNQVRLEPDLGTLVWPTGADIDPTVLHNWPQHVDAVIARRVRQFSVVA